MPKCEIQVDFKTLFLWRVNVFAKVLDNQAIIEDDLAIYFLMTSCINQINKWQHVGWFHLNEKEKPNMKNDILIDYKIAPKKVETKWKLNETEHRHL